MSGTPLNPPAGDVAGGATQSFDALFSPLDIHGMAVANRIMVAPMERNYANLDGTVSAQTLAHYESCARGGPGWIDIESTFVASSGRGRTNQLGLHDDRCVEGFSQLVAAIHRHGAKVGVELHHAGRNTSQVVSGEVPVAPSPVPCMEAGGDVPRALNGSEIGRLSEQYLEAAARAVAAGVDAVELHSAHGYLPLAFLSPRTNTRDDQFGGSFSNRARFATQIITKWRNELPAGTIIGCRFSCKEIVPGGLTLDDMVDYARILEDSGVNYLSVSAGIYESFKWIIPPMEVERGWLLDSVRRIKEAVSVPVIGAGRINDPFLADRAVREGFVDMVALGRAFLADPEFALKAGQGRAAEIVSCIGCNQGCAARVGEQLDVTCTISPRTGREGFINIKPAASSRTVAVIGGGPAGMEVARLAAQRGHRVTLYERGATLGGQAQVAGLLHGRGGWTVYVEEAEARLRRSGVEVRLGLEVTPDLLDSLDAEVIVVATGSSFDTRRSEGNATRITDPVELLSGGDDLSAEHVMVVGGGTIALDLAEHLCAVARAVTLVVGGRTLVEPPGQPELLERLKRCDNLAVELNSQIEGIGLDTVSLTKSGAIGPLDRRLVTGVDRVVIADHRLPRSGLWQYAEIVGNGEPGSPIIHAIGDCQRPAGVPEAILSATLLAAAL